jgi:hypothetical protein
MRSSSRRILLLIPTMVFLFAGMELDTYAQSESVIYSFADGSTDGAVPASGLTFHDGSIFGVTNEGGGFNQDGILFQLAPDGNGGWKENPVHIFEGGADGATPSPVVFDAAGNLYGEAVSYGAYGAGLIFEFSPTGSGWKMNVLYNFTGGSDGANPSGGLAFDAEGNLYGTTGAGGDLNLCQLEPWNEGCGVVFKLSRGSNGAWTESVLYTFTGQQDGYGPEGGLTFDGQGNVYGATMFYGFNSGSGLGLIFQLSPQTGGKWKYSVLHHFVGGAGGQLPFSNLILSGGSIYGTTWEGGMMSACNGLGCGIVYELSKMTKKFSLLHVFTGGADGGNLFSSLTLVNGSLFGTTQIGGDLSLCQGTGGSQGNGCGVVYRLSPGTTSANGIGGFRVVHTFRNSNNNDADGSDGRMTFDKAGNLYGESRIGGTYGLGAIFEIAP